MCECVLYLLFHLEAQSDPEDQRDPKRDRKKVIKAQRCVSLFSLFFQRFVVSRRRFNDGRESVRPGTAPALSTCTPSQQLIVSRGEGGYLGANYSHLAAPPIPNTLLKPSGIESLCSSWRIWFYCRQKNFSSETLMSGAENRR